MLFGSTGSLTERVATDELETPVIPHILIFLIAVLGALLDGVRGFFVAGICGFLLVVAVGWVLRAFAGGMLPRSVRDETATDFVARYPDLVAAVYPDASVFQAKEAVGTLLEAIMRRAVSANPSMNLNNAGTAEVFLGSAMQIAEEKPTEPAKALCRQLANFVATHPLWFFHTPTGTELLAEDQLQKLRNVADQALAIFPGSLDGAILSFKECRVALDERTDLASFMLELGNMVRQLGAAPRPMDAWLTAYRQMPSDPDRFRLAGIMVSKTFVCVDYLCEVEAEFPRDCRIKNIRSEVLVIVISTLSRYCGDDQTAALLIALPNLEKTYLFSGLQRPNRTGDE